MRYLNRIIFIDSAHIPYAEVRLDGNVHFIGTQGVGKSTVLRALLFFYNADRQKLGISKEKQSFDDYYLRHDYSRIIYEVKHDEGAFMAVAYRRARTAFRFIDAPYNPKYFIDSDNKPYSDWALTRQQVLADGFHISRIVEKFTEYRDIIYGNRHNIKPEFYKFSLMESSRYQNIPRTIQNVFLNSKLDADFIKDTIIRSMNDEEVELKLDYYRSQVSEFEQQYRDIELWTHKNSKGEIPIRHQANRVIDDYRNLKFVLSQIDELCRELNFAEQRDREALPVCEAELARLREANARVQRLIDEGKDKHDKEKQKLDRQIGVLDDRLKSIRQKKQHYQQININDIVRRVEKQTEVKAELERQQELRQALTRKYDDVAQKFKVLCQQTRQNLQQQKTEVNTALDNFRTQQIKEQEQLLKQLSDEKQKLEKQYRELLADIDERLGSIAQERQNTNAERLKISLAHPNADKIKQCEKQLTTLDHEASQLEISCTTLKHQVETLRAEAAIAIKALENESEKQTASLQLKRNEQQQALNKVSTLLSRYKGSLYEWLEHNKPEWKDSIGRVASEEAVLYNTALKPKVSNQGDKSFYGITLDLGALGSSARRPDELRSEKAGCEAAIGHLDEQISELHKKLHESTDKLRKDYSARISKLNQQIKDAENQLLLVPLKRKKIENEIDQLKKEEAEQQQKQLKEIDQQLEDIAHRLTTTKEEKKRKTAERDKRLKEADKRYEQKQAASAGAITAREKEAKSEIAGFEEQAAKQLAAYHQQEQDALAAKGIDRNQLQQIDAALALLRQEVDFIGSHLPVYYEYQRDQKDLLSHEEEYRQQRREQDERMNNLTERYAERRRRLDMQKADSDKEVASEAAHIKLLGSTLKAINEYKTTDTICPPQINTVGQKRTEREGMDLLADLRNNVYDSGKRQDAFKQAVNMFKGNFSAENTFDFKVNITTTDDYMEFAENLADFVTQNRIADYQRRVSDRYTEILQRIAVEVGRLQKNTSEIDKVINDINADFRERRNYALVIKSIAMQPKPSSDPLMHLLDQIKNFVVENQFNLGEEHNLFADNTDKAQLRQTTIDYLFALVKLLNDNPNRLRLTLQDVFQLQFRVIENDNDTGWVEKISNVGSDGTDILVKAMVNIMLISVFKKKVSRRNENNFYLHCMMDEIGKLHPSNVKGILNFANVRGIFLINSSPTTYNVSDYKYTYLLTKNNKAETRILPLISRKEADYEQQQTVGH